MSGDDQGADDQGANVSDIAHARHSEVCSTSYEGRELSVKVIYRGTRDHFLGEADEIQELQELGELEVENVPDECVISFSTPGGDPQQLRLDAAGLYHLRRMLGRFMDPMTMQGLDPLPPPLRRE